MATLIPFRDPRRAEASMRSGFIPYRNLQIAAASVPRRPQPKKKNLLQRVADEAGDALNVVQRNVGNALKATPIDEIGKVLETAGRNIPEIPSNSPARFLNNAAIRPIKKTDQNVGKILQGKNPYKGSSKQVAGQVLEDVANIASVVPVGRAAQAAVKAAPLGQKISTGVRTTAPISGAVGGTFGTSEALKDELGVKDTIRAGATGAMAGTAAGTVLGAGLPIAGAGARQTVKLAQQQNQKLGEGGYAKMGPDGKRTDIQHQLSEALKNGTDKPISFGTMSKKKFDEINSVRSSLGQRLLESQDIKVHPSVIKKLAKQRVQTDKLTPDQVADIAYSAVHNKNSRVIKGKYPHNQTLVKSGREVSRIAHVGEFDREASLKTAYPIKTNRLDKLSAPGGRGNPPSSTDGLNAPLPAQTPNSVRRSGAPIVPNNSGKVNPSRNIIPPEVQALINERSRAMKAGQSEYTYVAEQKLAQLGYDPNNLPVAQPTKGASYRKTNRLSPHQPGQVATPKITKPKTTGLSQQELPIPGQAGSSQLSSQVSATGALPTLPGAQVPARPQIPQLISDPSVPKIHQKTPVVNEGRRALAGAEKSTYKLRESFDDGENVPPELKEVLGAFGNQRTVKSNKELWQGAQQKVGTDPASAMKFFTENSNDDSVATGYALINRFMKGGQTKEAGEIAMTMAERALQSGRTTQAYALMKRLTPEGSVQYVENKVGRYLNQNPNARINWNDEVRKQLYDLADTVNRTPEGRDRNLLIGHMQELVDNIFPSSAVDKAITTWKAGLLTSLRTHERNILGNTINVVTEQASTVPGSIADRLMSLRTGKRTLVASGGRGMGSGAVKGAEIASDQIKTGIDVTNSNLKYNINHITWNDNKVEQTLKKFTEGVFRPLGAEDKLFKEAARENSLYNQAVALAKTKGLRGTKADEFVEKLVKNPTAKMRDIADDDAGRATFSHDNFLGDIIREGKGAVRRSNKRGAKYVSAALDILMPFTQIPSGVASQLYAYSPAKLMKSTYDIGKVLITGNDEIQRQAAQGFGRSVVGTSMIGAGSYLASKGDMVGQPRDEAERAQWEAQGIKPNSVRVGGRWYQLSSIGPQTLLVLAGAQMEQDKKADEAVWGNLAANIGKNFKDQTFLKGMSSALDAVGDPQRYADAYIQQQATSVIPNIVKDVARSVDPFERQTNSLEDRAKAGIPFASKGLPQRVDSYGQPLRNSGALELVDLFNSSSQKKIPEVYFTESLRNITGETKHIPGKVAKSVTINGEKLKLNSQQYSDYQKFVGTQSKDLLSRAQKDPAFMALSNEEKVRQIDSALQDINAAAKVILFGHNPKNQSRGAKSVLGGGKAPTSPTQAGVPFRIKQVSKEKPQPVANPLPGERYKTPHTKSGKWAQQIKESASRRGLDPDAVLAVAATEGLSGGVGDGGHAFGPFQLNDAGGVITGRFKTPEEARNFAESPEGIEFALDAIEKVSKGKKGADAIEAIVRQFERPANPDQSVRRALGIYGRIDPFTQVDKISGGGDSSYGSKRKSSRKSSGRKATGKSTKRGGTRKAPKIPVGLVSKTINTPRVSRLKPTPSMRVSMPRNNIPKAKRIKTPRLSKISKTKRA